MLKKILILLGRIFGYTTTDPNGITITEVSSLSHVVRIYNNNDRYIDLKETYLEFSGRDKALYNFKLEGIILEPYQHLVFMDSNNPVHHSLDTIYVRHPSLKTAMDNSLHVRIIHAPTDEMVYGAVILHDGEVL